MRNLGGSVGISLITTLLAPEPEASCHAGFARRSRQSAV